MANVFADLLQKGASQGILPSKAVDARNWFRKEASNINSTSTSMVTRNVDTVRTTLELGNMYFFRYDPKTKKELPYYDTFPLIFPVATPNSPPDGFYGLNFHYLPYVLRARFMDALYTVLNDKNLTDKSKIQLTYRVVKGLSGTPYYKTCLKYYLNSHVKSNFYYISPNKWDIALFLPVESFKKASKATVFTESIRKLNG